MTAFSDRISVLSRELSRASIAAVLGISTAEVAEVRADPGAIRPPATPAPGAYVLYYNPGLSDAFSAVGAAVTERSGFRQQIDLTRASQVRLVVYQSGRSGGSFLIGTQCLVPLTELAFTDEGVQGVDYVWGEGPTITIEGPGDANEMLVSDWEDLEENMKDDLVWRIVTSGGDGTGTVAAHHMDLQIR